MSNAAETISEILRQAYQIEVNGYTFYSMAADKAQKPAVQELFDKLARDETEHKAYLREVMRSVGERGAAAFQVDRRAPDLKPLMDNVFTDKFRAEAEGADFEMGVLSIGMQLESNAITYFSRAAGETSESEVKDFYEFLADWERQHLEALQNLFNAVRQDFWNEGRFSPF